MYETVSITDLELFMYMINRGTEPHKALENMIEHDQELKQTRQYLDAMIGNIDKSKQSHVV
jgi:soluble cytochrome b562